ncbi:hypothetical protein E2320_002363, partial [Naja naja]
EPACLRLPSTTVSSKLPPLIKPACGSSLLPILVFCLSAVPLFCCLRTKPFGDCNPCKLQARKAECVCVCVENLLAIGGSDSLERSESDFVPPKVARRPSEKRTSPAEMPFQKVKKSKKTRKKKCCRRRRCCCCCCCSSTPGPPLAAPPLPPPSAAGSSSSTSGAAAVVVRTVGEGPPVPFLDGVACEDQFDCKELESLFQNYNLKLEQTSTLKALAVLIALTASLALLELLSGPSLTISKGSHPVHCIIFLSLFIVTNVKYLQVTQLQQIVKLTLLFSFTFAFLCCPFSVGSYGMEPPSAPEQGMWQLMLVIFVSYSLLPVRTLLAIVFGLVVSVSHLIVTATSVSVKRQPLWKTVSRFPLNSSSPGSSVFKRGKGENAKKCSQYSSVFLGTDKN